MDTHIVNDGGCHTRKMQGHILTRIDSITNGLSDNSRLIVRQLPRYCSNRLGHILALR